MAIFETDQLIKCYLKSKQLNFKTQQEILITPIVDFFPNQTASTIHMTLLNHGLFNPDETTTKALEEWIDRGYWSIIDKLSDQLKKAWSGPNPNVFIFPIDVNEQKTSRLHDNVSGLSFSNLIVLFLGQDTKTDLIRATFAHEYSHSLRLQMVHNYSEHIQLKDTIILEGIAEVITKELYQVSFLPDITEIEEHKFEKWFRKWIKPNLALPSTHPLHRHLIYGDNSFPRYLGYYIGTYLVEKWQAKHQVSIDALIQIPTEEFLNDSLKSLP